MSPIKMKKFLVPQIFLLALIVLFFIVPSIADAQEAVVNKIGGAIVSGATSFLGDVVGIFIAPVAILVLKIVSLITGLSGIILNFVINHTIVQVAANYGKLTVINTAWTTIRDIANMGFIFVLLYASIQLILGTGKDTRGLIVKMIIAALLINFSLFFTRVVIDASNILALTFYKAIVVQQTGTGSLDSNDILNTGLSNALMEPLNLSSIWEMAGGLNPSNLATIGVLGSIVSLIAAFVFFAIALMFIIRYVVLIFVLILSPIAFISGIIPGIEGYAKQWKEALFGQAFFAPVYMLLTWITISIFQGLPRGTGSLAQAITGTMTTTNGVDKMNFETNSITLLFNFVVVIVFLILTLVISKSISDKAGGMVKKITGSALGFAGGATLGMAGRLGRNTFGRAGTAVGDSELLKKAVEKGGVGGMAARLTLAAGRKTAKGSFDLRGTALGGELSAGKAKTGGFEQTLKDKRETEKKFAESLGPSAETIAAAEREMEKAPKGSVERLALQARVDELKGVDEKEAIKRLKEKTPGLSDEAAKAEINLNREAHIRKGLGEIRKEKQIENLEKSPTFVVAGAVKKATDMAADAIKAMPNTTIPVLRMIKPTIESSVRNVPNLIKAKNRAAIAEIRKGKKSVKDLVDEALKEAGETPKKDEKTGEGGGEGKKEESDGGEKAKE
jgi:hypothetical protein